MAIVWIVYLICVAREFYTVLLEKNAISMCVKMKVYHSSEFTLYTDPTLT